MSTKDNTRLGFPVPASWGVSDIDDIYCIFVEYPTMYMAHKTTGVTALDTSWENAAVVGAKQSTTDTGTNTFSWVCDPPPLDVTKAWAVCFFENSTPVETDSLIASLWYDPDENVMCTDAGPVRRGSILTSQRQR